MKTNVQTTTRELNGVAREMRTTGAAADSDLDARMNELGAQLAATKSQARDISGQMGGVNVAMHESATAGGDGVGDIGFYLRELHALADEFGATR